MTISSGSGSVTPLVATSEAVVNIALELRQRYVTRTQIQLISYATRTAQLKRAVGNLSKELAELTQIMVNANAITLIYFILPHLNHMQHVYATPAQEVDRHGKMMNIKVCTLIFA